MANRLPNPRRAKINRSYSVDEVASLYGVHRNTVRQWIKHGLPVVRDIRPSLILGSELREFVAKKRTKRKQPCRLGEIYCLRCRAPKAPALGMVEYEPITATRGNLIGFCPACEGLIYRGASLAKLDSFKGHLSITFTKGKQHIYEISNPSLNSDFKAGD